MSDGNGGVEPTEVEARIAATSNEIESRLGSSLTDGKIDMAKLRTEDEALFQVLDAFAQSKTWRDDPRVSASDVAKLLEAQARTTPLGAALENLQRSLDT